MTRQHQKITRRLSLLVLLLNLYLGVGKLHAQGVDRRYDRALESFFRQDYDTAHELLSTLAHETPERLPAQAYLFKAIIERNTRAYDESLATFAQGRRVHPTDRVLILEMAVTYSWSEHLEEALALYDELLQQHPNYLPARHGRALILSWLGRYDEAMELYQQLAIIPTTRLEAFEGIAFIYAAQGHRTRARQYYDEILAVDAEHEGAKQGIARLEQMSVGQVENTTSVVARRGADALWETRTAFGIKPNARWSLRAEHVLSARSQDTTAVVLPFAGGQADATLAHLLSAELGRALDWRARHHVSVQGSYQLRLGQWSLGGAASHRVTERLTAIYGVRHQRGDSENSNLYRGGLSFQKTNRFQNITQLFVSTSSAQDGVTVALASQQRYWVMPDVLCLDVTLSPGRTAMHDLFLVGEAGLSWKPPRSSRLTLNTGLQAGFQHGFIRGAKAGARWDF